jgi:transposase
VVNTLLNNNNNNNKRMSIRKALAYSGCSKNMYYYNSIKQKKYPGNHITTAAVAAVTASSSSSSTTTTMIEQEIQQISMERPSYGTRRMAAMLTRILGIPVNRKRVQRIFRKMGYITPCRRKKDIIHSKVPNVKTDRPNQVWEADLTYIHCVVLMDGATYSTYLTYLQENGLAIVSTCLQSRKMQSFLLKILL